MPITTLTTPEDLAELVGRPLGESSWHEITQDQVNLFADATGDHQWIHIDASRAAQGPFGSTIAHGFLTLSLLPMFFQRTILMRDVKMGVNYGLNRVRFTSPVPVGSELRARFKLVSCEDIADNGAQMVWEVTFERKGSERPVCVAESISRRYA